MISRRSMFGLALVPLVPAQAMPIVASIAHSRKGGHTVLFYSDVSTPDAVVLGRYTSLQAAHEAWEKLKRVEFPPST